MAYQRQWRDLSTRIRGLMQAGEYHVRLGNRDSYGRWKHLRDHCIRVVASLAEFQSRHGETLPSGAREALATVLKNTGDLLRDTTGAADLQEERAQKALLMLVVFEAEMSFLILDGDEIIRSRSDRAFEHLQRSIVVDPDIRAKWIAAFGEGEVACEKLGAVHLLAHDIWAFKVNAEGGRTDLVYQEALTDIDRVTRTANGLVLTEWKRAAEADEPARRFAEARAQAARYAAGVLAGVELTSYRYAVVVSEGQIDVPADLREGRVIYRHFNIAVKPRTPSRA